MLSYTIRKHKHLRGFRLSQRYRRRGRLLNVTSCNVLEIHREVTLQPSLCYPEDGGSCFLQDGKIFLPIYTASRTKDGTFHPDVRLQKKECTVALCTL